MAKKNIVGENIRALRVKAGITQEEIALRSGLSQSFINYLEHGKRKYTQNSLELIARALSVQVVDLLKEKGAHAAKIAEAPVPYRTRRFYRKAFLSVLKDLPDSVLEHYLVLLLLERELLKREKEDLLKEIAQ